MTTRVVWWLGSGPSRREFRELFVEPFNAGQDDVLLEVVELTSRPRERTFEALESGTGPDILMVPRAGHFRSLIGANRLLDLTPYADRYDWHSRLLRPATRMSTVDGRLFGLPRSTETMMLLFDPRVLAGLGHEPPATLAELEDVAAAAMRRGLTPFSAGCGDMPESAELLWTLVVNHYAGPAAVRAALHGELPWTDNVFVEAVQLLRSWFDRGWFGTGYFTDTIEQGLGRVVNGTAAMVPAMTGMLPEDNTHLDVVPFPALRNDVAAPMWVFCTASLLGINAATAVPDEAARVFDALFDPRVRRLFGARVPGDWNIPLTDADADGLTTESPRIFAKAAVGVTEAVAAGRFGYATWSFLPPKAEALVVDQVRPVVEGRLAARDHLAELQSVFAEELAAGAVPGLD
ncbi:extracellular solute-binding protein [Actinoplanes sp. NBRC 103695]|uniref:ABC transporter substrate-binding protein n=1 Tax=Actinoplanes sp. NBRC 103695 TaxID=3032202 RepID=UPI0024A293AD|nr:extracellular solute-binding protein [Actinoplanes sp. NBRC 103695]GLZ01366.1 ABC transporter substrate-binding protein [Actinoplanes sp. NBRC 103695]